MHLWRNWQTRMVQVHIFERKCRFDSCQVHQTVQIRTLCQSAKGSDFVDENLTAKFEKDFEAPDKNEIGFFAEKL